ncbi:MAG: hypothetical protein ACP5ID_06490 [Conexivisphaera sp.]
MDWLPDWLILLISTDPVFAALLALLLLALLALAAALLSFLAPLLPGIAAAVAAYLLTRDPLLAIAAFLLAEAAWIAARGRARAAAAVGSEYLE